MTFGEAIEAMKVGNRVSREAWSYDRIWIELVNDGLNMPYFRFVNSQSRELWPWPAPHDDLLAGDWFVPAHRTAHSDDPGAF